MFTKRLTCLIGVAAFALTATTTAHADTSYRFGFRYDAQALQQDDERKALFRELNDEAHGFCEALLLRDRSLFVQKRRVSRCRKKIVSSVLAAIDKAEVEIVRTR